MALQFACSQAVTEEQVELSGCSCALDDMAWTIGDLIDAATDAVAQISGGAMTGRCEMTVRPCEMGGCACGRGRGCNACTIAGMILPGFNPEVSEVKIDGVVLDPSEYVLVDSNMLVRV